MNSVIKPILIAVALPAAIVALAGCSSSASVTVGGPDTIDAQDLEAKLADQLAPQAGLKPGDVTVACPEDQEIQTGAKFECTLTTPNGDEVQVNVTLTDDSGGFHAVVPKQ